MLKLRGRSRDDSENIAGIFAEQYLARVFQYIHYWVYNQAVAEDLTLKVIKRVINRDKDFCRDEEKFVTAVFAASREEIRNYSPAGPLKPLLLNLSHQEQEVISLKLGAVLDNRKISLILNLPESCIGRIICESLRKLNGRNLLPEHI